MAMTLNRRPTLWRLFVGGHWDELHARCERRFDTDIPKGEFLRVMERDKHSGQYAATNGIEDCFIVWLKNRVVEAGGCRSPERPPGCDELLPPVYEKSGDELRRVVPEGLCDHCRNFRQVSARTCAGKPLCQSCVDNMPKMPRLNRPGWSGPCGFNNIPYWDNLVRALEEDR